MYVCVGVFVGSKGAYVRSKGAYVLHIGGVCCLCVQEQQALPTLISGHLLTGGLTSVFGTAQHTDDNGRAIPHLEVALSMLPRVSIVISAHCLTR